MTIHDEHPFLPPEGDRDPLRRFRGRLAAPVSVWTTGMGSDREGLTVSSMLVADGGDANPAELLGLVDEDSDLADALLETRTVCVSLLGRDQDNLGDAFAGIAPAPGGAFRLGEWIDTEWGPRLSGSSWLGARITAEPGHAGWALLVRARIEHVEVASDAPIAHYRGQYVDLSRL